MNKILILFVASVSFLFFLGKEFIESDYFSKIVSTRINQLLLNNSKFNFQYSGLEVSIWPFVTVLKNLRLSYGNPESIKISFDEFQIGFELLDIFSRKININQVKLLKGVVHLDDKNYNSKSSEQSENYYIKIRHLIDQLPFEIQQIIIEKFVIINPELSISLERLDLLIKQKEISYSLDLMMNGKLLSDIQIDKLQMEGAILAEKMIVKKGSINEKDSALFFAGEFNHLSGTIDCSAEFNTNGSSIHRYLKGVKVPFDFESNDISGSLKISGTSKRPKLDYQVLIHHLTTEWLKLDLAKLSGVYHGKRVTIDKFQGTINQGVIELKNAFNIIDENGLLLPEKRVSLELNKVKVIDALYYLREEMDILKGEITGKLDLSWSDNNMLFTIGPNCQWSGFLLGRNLNRPILKNDLLILNTSIVDVHFKGGVDFKIDLQIVDSKINAIGNIKNGIINFESKNSLINFQQLGPIAGQQVAGVGNVDFKINGKVEDVRFYFNYSLGDFSFARFKMKNIKGAIVLSLKDDLLKIEDHVSDFEGMFALINGKVDLKGEYLKLSVALRDTNWSGIRYLLENFMAGLKLPDARDFQFVTEGSLEIQMNNFKSLDIEARLRFKGIKLFGEVFDSANVLFQVKDEKLHVQEFNLTKGKGNILGFLIYNLANKNFNYSLFSTDIVLDDFELYRILNLGLSGDIYFESFGESNQGVLNTKTILKLTDSYIADKQLEDSLLIIQQKNQVLEVTGALLEDQVIMESKIEDRQIIDQKYVELNVGFNITKINELISILNPKLNLLAYRGKIEGRLSSKFMFPNWENADVLFQLEQLEIFNDKGLLLSQRPNGGIEVTNGIIKRWDLNWIGDDNSIISKGSGDLRKQVKIESNFNLNAEMFAKLLPSVFERSNGHLGGHFLLLGNRERNDLFISAQGPKLSIKLVNAPGQFEDIQIQSSLAGGNQLLIQALQAKYEGGSVGITGKVLFTLPFPSAELKVSLQNCNLRPIAKTSFIISGDLALQGNSLPYLLSGKVNVLLGEVSTEFNDFGKNVVETNANPYIPQIASLEKINLHIIENRVAINFLRPLRIKNSLVDLMMNGDFSLAGFPSLPQVQGQMSAIPEVSKIKLNGHDFVLSEASALVNKTDFGTRIDLRIDGKAKISDYTVQLVANGDASDLKITLSSDPYLPQEDVLSLITLGVTREMSKNIQEKDRSAIASIGLGNLLVEQLKLGEGLKKMGFQLSIRPEFEEEKFSYLEGRTTGENISKFKSATKISLQQTFGANDKFNFGLSSTVGGSMLQKKEFNVNYFLKRNLSLGAVYEVKEKAAEGVETTSSFGMDFKIKVDF